MRTQLDLQISEIQLLRDTLAERSNRDENLRYIPLLQADLKRVISEVDELGRDLEKVKRERDEMSRREGNANNIEWKRIVEEGERSKKRLAAAERALDEHICPK
jgi:seryl-tRNA synthetase